MSAPDAPSGGRSLVLSAHAEAKKARKPTLAEMRDLVRSEAARIEIVQAALIDGALRAEPDAGQIARLATWDAIERLIEMFIRHEDRARPFFLDLELQRKKG